MSDTPTNVHETRPTAKKVHWCCECRGIINVGEAYHSYAGKWGEDWRTYKTCLDCFTLRDEFAACMTKDEFPEFGQLPHAVFESRNTDHFTVERFMLVCRKRSSPPSAGFDAMFAHYLKHRAVEIPWPYPIP